MYAKLPITMSLQICNLLVVTSIPHSPIYSSDEEQEKEEQKQTHEQEDIKNPNKKSSHPNTNTPKDNSTLYNNGLLWT